MTDDPNDGRETMVPITREEFVLGPLRGVIRRDEPASGVRPMVGRLLRSLRRSLKWAGQATTGRD